MSAHLFSEQFTLVRWYRVVLFGSFVGPVCDSINVVAAPPSVECQFFLQQVFLNKQQSLCLYSLLIVRNGSLSPLHFAKLRFVEKFRSTTIFLTNLLFGAKRGVMPGVSCRDCTRNNLFDAQFPNQNVSFAR